MKATFDFTDGWIFSSDDSNIFTINFSNGTENRLYPKNLSFGWICGDERFEWPPLNTVLREISSNRVFQFRLKAKPDETVVFSVWAENNGKRFEAVHEWIVPRPEKPFPSWVWEENGWTSPEPYPDSGLIYEWDEDSLTWIEMEA